MSFRPSHRPQRWIAIAGVVVCAQFLLSVTLSRGFVLTAIGDLTQCALLFAVTICLLPNAISTDGQPDTKARLFWALMTLGSAIWLISQVLWTYFEVFLRHDVPNPFVGDVVLFLHIVPMMAALAVRPHRHDDQLARPGSLDFVLLLIWWLYLFVFLVIPWMHVHPDEAAYGQSFNLLYLAEHLAFLFGLATLWRESTGHWKTIYAQLLGAAMLYAVSSIAASVAIDFRLYYTGSFFDVPLVAAMTWFAGVGLIARDQQPKQQPAESASVGPGIWAARLAMLAVFSTPLMVAWSAFARNIPAPVRTYRLLLTVGVMLIMGLLVFLKQHWLDRELIHLLETSRQNLEEMRDLKDALERKEKSLTWHSMELQRKNLELQEVSFTDSLTGVWNRRYLEETLTAEAGQVLRSYQRAHEPAGGKVEHRDLVFIMVDVDFFKRVNDDYGHTVGDELLQKIAQRLSRIMRRSDVLVRWGGEEFLIMSRSADRSGTPVFCSRILEVMASEPFELANDIRVRKTCSIGWAPYPWCTSAFEAICAEEAIELADTALYSAKAAGRNQSVGFLPSAAAGAAPHRISMATLRDKSSGLIKAVKTPGFDKTAPCEPAADAQIASGESSGLSAGNAHRTGK